MEITLPNDLERRVQSAVQTGRFASIDDAMAEAARMLLRDLDQGQPRPRPTDDASNPGPGFIGALRDDAEWLDQAVAHAMKVREERPWRSPAGE